MTKHALPVSWLDEPMVDGSDPVAPGFSLPVGTVTFLLTDIEGSTRRWEATPNAMAAAVARHYEILDAAIKSHHGVRPIEQGEGDSVVGAFSRASDAVAAAVDAQRALTSERWPDDATLRVRMALHTGEAELRDAGNYFGRAVIRCARLRAIAHGGQIVISGTTADLVVDGLPDGASLIDAGLHRLRDLGRPERVWQLTHPDVQSGFGPLRSLDVLPNNLPVQLTNFVGRGLELGELRELLATTRLLSLTGAGGCGKTRLAMQLAADVLDHYDGGAWLVELAPVADPDQVPVAVAGGLGERDLSGDLVETIVGRIGEQATLVLLDNCEHLLDSVAALTHTLLQRCPNLTIVATSREPIGVPGETAWRVPSLALPARATTLEIGSLSQYDAVRLFLDRATKARPNFRLTNDNAPAVAQICDRLDGIPLAIELAAARVRGMAVEQLASGLDDRFRLLTGGARTVLPRQQTLQASVDWGYDLLAKRERAAFRRLTVFVDGFTLDAAEHVAAGDDVDAVEVLDILLALVDKSMVNADDDTGRYRMLETLRQYGMVRLLDAGETPATRDRHLAWALEFGSQLEVPWNLTRSARRAERLEPEIDNLRAAFEWAMVIGNADAAHQIASDLIMWGQLRGRDTRETIVIATRALSLAGARRELRLLTLARRLLARSSVRDTSDDTADFDLLVTESADIDDDLIRCQVLNLAAMGCARRPSRALQLWTAALDAAERTGIAELQGALAAGLASAHLLMGNRDEGQRLAVGLLDSPDPGTAMIAAQVLTFLSMANGNYAETRRFVDFAEATQTFPSGPFVGRCAVAAARVWVDLVQGSGSGDRTAVEALLAEARRRGFPLGIRLIGWVPGVHALLEGDTATAVRELVAWRSELPGFTFIAGLHPFDVHALLAAERFEDARSAVDSIRLTQREQLAQVEQHLLHVDGLLARVSGDVAGAERLHHEALALQHTGGWRPELVHTLEALAGIAAATDSYVECARLAGAAQALRDALGYVLRWPFEQRLFDTAIAAARADLGDESFDQAYNDGRSLDCDAAVAYATRARGERQRPTTGWASLTPTEADVALLASEGLTNKQIAARLLMGSETVKTHLSHVYDKLHVRTRTALASAVLTKSTTIGSGTRG
jgi:predicted ATPase/class 3 adenylate cyclase/DNA-binding CsgD family transcriptional regulator